MKISLCINTVTGQKCIPCESYNIPDANVDSLHHGKSPQTASESPSDTLDTWLQTLWNNDNGSILEHRAHNKSPEDQIL